MFIELADGAYMAFQVEENEGRIVETTGLVKIDSSMGAPEIEGFSNSRDQSPDCRGEISDNSLQYMIYSCGYAVDPSKWNDDTMYNFTERDTEQEGANILFGKWKSGKYDLEGGNVLIRMLGPCTDIRQARLLLPSFEYRQEIKELPGKLRARCLGEYSGPAEGLLLPGA